MIIHKLMAMHLKHRDNEDFYWLQAEDAIHWLRKQRVPLGPGIRALDLGAGHGIFGACLRNAGCDVTFADESNLLMPSLQGEKFLQFNIDRESLSRLGTYDLVICSNVLEHLSKPQHFIAELDSLLAPHGYFFLSWTNWLSPWGGHEFSPFHYFGPRLGVRLYDKFSGRPRYHTPFVNLFPTSIGDILRHIRRNSALDLVTMAPRYYPEFRFLTRLPLLREFLTWNCALLLRRKNS